MSLRQLNEFDNAEAVPTSQKGMSSQLAGMSGDTCGKGSKATSPLLLSIRVSPRRMGVHTIDIYGAATRHHRSARPPPLCKALQLICLLPDVLYRGICFGIAHVLPS